MTPIRARLLSAAAVATGVAAIVVALLADGLEPLEPGGAPVVLQLLPVALGFGLVGALLLVRRPENRIGWLLAAVGLLDAAGYLIESTADLVLAVGWTRLAVTQVLVGQVLHDTSVVGAVVLLPVLFPTGRVPSPRWRWLPATALGLAAVSGVSLLLLPDAVEVAGVEFQNPHGLVAASGVVHVLAGVSFVGMLALALPAGASLVVRFRAASGIERLQLRWFVLAILWLVGSVVVMLLWVAAWNVGLLPNPSNLLFEAVVGIGATTIPLAIGAAVLRYRLYDIDRLVSRSVAWAATSLVLVAAYLGAVVGLQAVLGPLFGDGDLPVALATLAVAAAARPLLRRVQAAVDRRFNRARYDAARTVDEFGRDLRDQVSRDAIVTDLTDVVTRTFQPRGASVVVLVRDGTGPGS